MPEITKRTQAQLISASSGLVAFFLFFLCLPRTITGGDAGELTVAAYFLGIPHPPGYPTWCLAAHPFTWIPWGSVAWRVALSSAVFGALACSVVGLIVFELTATAWAGFVAGVLLACARPFYEQAIIAEVYTLNAFFFSLCVYALVRWTREQREPWLWALALLTGLGQGVHNTFFLLAGIFALYVLYVEPRFVLHLRRLGICLAIFLAVFGVFLYLPLRSRANPPIDWGNPETWDNFLAVLCRDQFAFMYGQRPHTFELLGQQTWDIAGETLFTWGLAFPLSLLALFGIAYMLLRNRREYGLILAVGLVPVLAITWLQNPLRTGEWREVMLPFYLPLAWLFAIAAGIALGMPKGFPRLRVGASVSGLLLLIPTFYVISFWRLHTNYSEPSWVDAYSRNLLTQIPKDSILFAGPDHAAFPILYLQSVDGLRNDVTLGNIYGYVDVALVAGAPPELRNQLGPHPARHFEPKYYAWLLTHTDRPVYFSQVPRLDAEVPFQFRQEGLLYRAIAATDSENTPRWPDTYTWPTNDYRMRDSFARGYTARQIVAEYQLKRIAFDLSQGGDVPIDMRMENLRSVVRDDPEYLNNAGALLARQGDWKLSNHARELFEQALECEPENAEILGNLEKVKKQLESMQSGR